jgi:hypothetical protein
MKLKYARLGPLWNEVQLGRSGESARDLSRWSSACGRQTDRPQAGVSLPGDFWNLFYVTLVDMFLWIWGRRFFPQPLLASCCARVVVRRLTVDCCRREQRLPAKPMVVRGRIEPWQQLRTNEFVGRAAHCGLRSQAPRAITQTGLS